MRNYIIQATITMRDVSKEALTFFDESMRLNWQVKFDKSSSRNAALTSESADKERRDGDEA